MNLTFYEKVFANNYEELITYYPAFYQQVYEMQEILKAQGKLADGVEAGIERAYLNNFIDYADAETIGNLETFLKLDYNRTKELEVRRRIVKAHFVGNGKMSATLIKNMLQAYTKAEVDIRFEPFDEDGNNMLFIDFQRGVEETVYISDIINLFGRRIPAHIKCKMNIGYKQHGMIFCAGGIQAVKKIKIRQVG